MNDSIWNDRIAGPNSPTNMQFGYFVMRIMLGLNLFMHGSMRHLSGIGNWVEQNAESFVDTILPMPMVIASLYLIPTAQIILGTFLLLGLCTRPALLGSVLLFLVLDVGHGVRQMWPGFHLIMHYSIYIWVLLVLHRQNWLALDNRIFLKDV